MAGGGRRVAGNRSRALADHVSEARIWRFLLELAQYGATANGGVNRQALSAEDIAARIHVVRWAEKQGFSAFQDEIGNLFIRRDGAEPGLPPVLTGSHLDSQPKGGRFDGAFGVVAGLEVLQALNDAGTVTRRPVEVVAWTNEEGSRFSPGAMGSSVFARVRDLSAVLEVRDRDDVLLRDALRETLAATPATTREAGGGTVHCYLEAHIEQGPLLEEAGLCIGVVTGIQGIARLTVDVVGEEAHAGTVPRRARKDALSGAVAVVSALERELGSDDDLRFTVGRFEVFPGSPNTVPGRAHFTIDLRHPHDARLHAARRRIHEVAMTAAGPCSVSVSDISHVRPTVFPDDMLRVLRRSADGLGYGAMSLPSGAGHDAMHLAGICPTGMLFIPCLRGISHNEAESITSEHAAAGTRVLAEAVAALAQE